MGGLHLIQKLVWRSGCVSLAVALAVPLMGVADTIHLKNGKKIVAASTREEPTKVIYQTAGGEFAIPLSLVDHIEKSQPPDSMPPEGPAESSPARSLLLLKSSAVEPAPESHSPVIQQGGINEAYLAGLDREVDDKPTDEGRRRLAQAYREAARFLVGKGDPEAAIEKYRHALSLSPNDPGLEVGLGNLLVAQNRPWEATELLLPAVDRNPKVRPIHVLLGSAFYAQEDLDQAITEWNKAQSIQDTADVREALDKAERERSAAAFYQELRSPHFLLRYDESEVKGLANEMLKALEDLFGQLQLDLEIYPQETITVLLYPKQAFRDITRSPTWAGAVNDGKIRVPVSGVSTMTLELTRMLKHELTHSFIRQATLDRCPQWFNEGLAQLEEGATTLGLRKEMASAFAEGVTPPYSALESSFMGLPQEQARLAYMKSLAALEYLRDAHGLTDIRQLLKLAATTPDFGSALQQELQLTYPDFEREVENYVSRRNGSS